MTRYAFTESVWLVTRVHPLQKWGLLREEPVCFNEFNNFSVVPCQSPRTMSTSGTPRSSSIAGTWEYLNTPATLGDSVDESDPGSRDGSKRALPYDEGRQSKSPRSCSPAPPMLPLLPDSYDSSGAMSAEGRGHGEPDPAGTASQVALLSDEAVSSCQA